MEVRIDPEWGKVLRKEFEKEYFYQLTEFVRQEYRNHRIFPPAARIFAAFDHCSFSDVKVVILGQDPYHGPGQANGLCFSVNPGVDKPPSLINIFKELSRDMGISVPDHGDLQPWAEQGVLMLNATLTVRAHRAGSHQHRGWEEFTDAAIKALSAEREKLVFMLWGSYAQKKGQVIDPGRHLILKAPHPSPLSAHRGFFGCGHFSKANRYLRENGIAEVQW